MSLLKFLFGGNSDPTTFNLDTVVKVLNGLQEMLLFVAAFEAIVGMIMVGYQYFTAYGDEAKAAQAKKTFYWIIIGMVIILLSKIIVYEVQRVVTGDTTHAIPVQETTNPLLTP